MPGDWSSFLGADAAALLPAIEDRVAEARLSATAVFPTAENVFAAFRATPVNSVRAVILGQDPYFSRPGQADGLAFSVSATYQPRPRSLAMILKELAADQGCAQPVSGSLEPWAQRGVLLLNTALTVEQGVARSHWEIGWLDLTRIVLTRLSLLDKLIVFLVWGNEAQNLADGVGIPPERIILSAHPAARSATAFLTTRPFQRANDVLGTQAIDWCLP